MTSKAERKRRKKAATISLPGGEAVPQRIEGAGRPRKMVEDARKTALQARCRVFGLSDTTEALKASVAPLWGCSVGRMILTEPEAKRADLGERHSARPQDTGCLMTAPSERPAATPNACASSPRWTPCRPTPHPQPRMTEASRSASRDATCAQMQVEGWIGHHRQPRHQRLQAFGP